MQQNVQLYQWAHNRMILKVNVRVRQGCLLSQSLFKVFLFVMMELEGLQALTLSPWDCQLTSGTQMIPP